MLKHIAYYNSCSRVDEMPTATGIHHVGAEITRPTVIVDKEMHSPTTTVVPFYQWHRPVDRSTGWVNPTFNREPTARAHIQTGTGRHSDIHIRIVIKKRLTYFSNTKTNSIFQYAIVNASTISGIALPNPPTHQPGRRGNTRSEERRVGKECRS